MEAILELLREAESKSHLIDFKLVDAMINGSWKVSSSGHFTTEIKTNGLASTWAITDMFLDCQ